MVKLYVRALVALALLGATAIASTPQQAAVQCNTVTGENCGREPADFEPKHGLDQTARQLNYYGTRRPRYPRDSTPTPTPAPTEPEPSDDDAFDPEPTDPPEPEPISDGGDDQAFNPADVTDGDATDEPPVDEPPLDEEPTDEPTTDDEPPLDEEPTDEPTTDDLPTDEPPVDEEPTDEPTTDELPTNEPALDDEPTDEPSSDDLPTDEPSTDEEPTDKPATDEEPTDEPSTDDLPTDEPSTDDLPTDEPSTDDQPTDEPSTDDQPTDEPSTDDQPTDEPSTDDLPTDEPSTDDQPTDEPSTDDQPTDEPSTDDQPTDEPSTDDLPTDEPSTDDLPTDEPSTDDQPTDEPSTDDIPTDEPSTDEQPTDEPSTDDLPTDKPTTDDLPTDAPSTDDQSTDEPSTDDLPTDEPSTDDLPTDEPSTDDLPTDEPPTDDLPTDEPSIDDLPTDEPSTDDVPTDEPSTDDLPTDEPSTDDLPTDEPPTDGEPTDEPPTDDLPTDEPLPATTVSPTTTEAPVTTTAAPLPTTTAPLTTTILPSTSTTAPPPVAAPVCTAKCQRGDQLAGIDIVTDASCVNGGLGCLGTVCRFCKRWDSASSKHLNACDLILNTLSTTTAPSTTPASTAPTTPAPQATSQADAQCGAWLSTGDRAVGILIALDQTCVKGGVGCITGECRYCRSWETTQSRHMKSCSSLAGVVSPISTSTPAPALPATTPAPATTTLAPTPTISQADAKCGAWLSSGDRAVGILIAIDDSCVNGGVGCITSACRYCRAWETTQSRHTKVCTSFASVATSTSTSTTAPVTPATTAAPATTTSVPVVTSTSSTAQPNVATPAPQTTSQADAQCGAWLSVGDRAVGILIALDQTCVKGGVGCITTTCRYCRAWETPQSRHMMACSSFATVATALSGTANPPASPAATSSGVIASPSSVADCDSLLTSGDRSVGISIFSDDKCAKGGLGCIGYACRYCRVKDTAQSKHLQTCDSYSSQSTTTTTTSSPISTSAPAASSDCASWSTTGDRAVGIFVAIDTTCARGGVGCIRTMSCRYCRKQDTTQSHHLKECSQFSTVVDASTVVSKSFGAENDDGQISAGGVLNTNTLVGMTTGCVAAAIAVAAFAIKRYNGRSKAGGVTTPTGIEHRRSSVFDL